MAEDIKNKTCSMCFKEKPISMFGRRPDSKIGYKSACKPCSNKNTKKWREKNPKYHKNYFHNHKDYFRLHSRKFRENHPGCYEGRCEKEKEHRKYLYILNKKKVQAHRTANIYLYKNNIKKLPCFSCSINENIEMHHQDYSKPLEVAFLCKSCHRMLHYGHDINYTIVDLRNIHQYII